MFSYTYAIKMFDTDASGFLFFTSQLRMAHEAFEAFMAEKGLGLSRILKTTDFLLPIVHAETDHKSTSHVGDSVVIQVTAERIGTTSFTLHYQVVNDAGVEIGTAQTVHVAMDKTTRTKSTLPPDVRAAVETIKA